MYNLSQEKPPPTAQTLGRSSLSRGGSFGAWAAATPGARPGICLVAGVLTLGFSSPVLFLGPGLVLLFKSMTDMWWALSLTKMYPEVCLAYGGGGLYVPGEGRSRGTAAAQRQIAVPDSH